MFTIGVLLRDTYDRWNKNTGINGPRTMDALHELQREFPELSEDQVIHLYEKEIDIIWDENKLDDKEDKVFLNDRFGERVYQRVLLRKRGDI